jgi:hypothetical protein
MLLVLTGSGDVTSDLLFKRLGNRAFRFNFDIFQEYQVSVRPSHWTIRNPHGLEVSSETATHAFWWKAFHYFTQQEQFIDEEVKYIFRELYNWFARKGIAKGNPPDFHNQKGKIYILGLAQPFFPTPKSLTGWNFKDFPIRVKTKRYVAKSLASGLTTTNKALFTTEIDATTLDYSYPWFLQETIEAEADVTVFICGRRRYGFLRSRDGLVGLDWRKECFTNQSGLEWQPRDLSTDETKAVDGFCRCLGVEWGRLDFLQVEGRLTFLEFNANGQWAFLDPTGKLGLVDGVIHYLLGEP